MRDRLDHEKNYKSNLAKIFTITSLENEFHIQSVQQHSET